MKRFLPAAAVLALILMLPGSAAAVPNMTLREGRYVVNDFLSERYGQRAVSVDRCWKVRRNKVRCEWEVFRRGVVCEGATTAARPAEPYKTRTVRGQAISRITLPGLL